MPSYLFVGGVADRQYHQVPQHADFFTVRERGPAAASLSPDEPRNPAPLAVTLYKRVKFTAEAGSTARDRIFKELEVFALQQYSHADVLALLIEAYSWGTPEEEESNASEFAHVGSDGRFRIADAMGEREVAFASGGVLPGRTPTGRHRLVIDDVDVGEVESFSISGAGSFTPSVTPSVTDSFSPSLSLSPSPSASPSEEPMEVTPSIPPDEYIPIPFKQQMETVARELRNFGFTVYEAARSMAMLGRAFGQVRERDDEEPRQKTADALHEMERRVRESMRIPRRFL